MVASSMRGGQFTVGDFALFVSYIAWLSQVTSMFGNYLTQYKQMGVSIDRLLALFRMRRRRRWWRTRTRI